MHESQHGQRLFLISMETPVENPIDTIASFNRQFQLTQKQAKAVEAAWMLEDGATMFNVINSYTRAAQGTEMTAEEAYRLEKVGGQILALVKPR